VAAVDAPAVLVTCEHGGKRVPAPYRTLFEGQAELLDTHRGWDPGALTLAREMAAAFEAPLFASTTTRLLVDLNRSIGTPRLHSEFTRTLSLAERRRIVAEHYRPHHAPIEDWVESAIARGRRVVHIASHSFTPELDGEVRKADVGLLYDPGRTGEVALAGRWTAALRRLRPDLRLRRNYPYRGNSDGLTFRMRRIYPPQVYVGIELEVNQRFVRAGGRPWPKLRRELIDSLRAALEDNAAAPSCPPKVPRRGAGGPILA
jgi:predicted N-formylglutamate amidohydrolase